MSVPPAWCAQYVGLPFAEKGRTPPLGFDCWGLARWVLMVEFGVRDVLDLTGDYLHTHDKYTVARTVEATLKTRGTRLSGPEPGAVIILRIAGRPWHCGVCVDDQWMMHVVAGANVVLERLDSWAWSDRIEGFYRYVG